MLRSLHKERRKGCAISGVLRLRHISLPLIPLNCILHINYCYLAYHLSERRMNYSPHKLGVRAGSPKGTTSYLSKGATLRTVKFTTQPPIVLNAVTTITNQDFFSSKGLIFHGVIIRTVKEFANLQLGWKGFDGRSKIRDQSELLFGRYY